VRDRDSSNAALFLMAENWLHLAAVAITGD
jgi:hypothetical protein